MSIRKRNNTTIFFILVVALVAAFVLVRNQKITPRVQGLEIAKGGDDSGESSGSSGGGSGESSGSGGSNTTTNTSTTEPTHEPIRTFVPKPTEKPEIENEAEKEVENEQKPETPEIKNTQFKISDDGLELESGTVSAVSKFPIAFNKLTNTLLVITGNGTKEIRILPGQASSIAQTSGIENEIEKIELEQSKTDQNIEVFKVSGKRNGKLFGLINVSEPVETEINAQTGQVVSTTNNSLLFQFLSPFIK